MNRIPSQKRAPLGPGAEFDVIRRFLAGQGALPTEVRVGPGDDAAVLEGGWVISTDLSVEDVHFRRAWLDDEEVGYRATAAALSDLAAMGADAVGVLVSMALPSGRGVDAGAINRGVLEAVGACGACVLGGDLSRSPGPVVLDVTVVGRASSPILRGGALPGDEVWVTGTLGASAAAVRLWESGTEPVPELRMAYARPTPRLREACCLVEEDRVHALVDLSDGLAGDAGHLAAAGAVRIVLEPALLPLAEPAVEALGEDEARQLALHGGEDYELCFAAPTGIVSPPRFEAHFGIGMTRVGRVEEGSGVFLDHGDGDPTPVITGGFDHLAEGSP